MFLQVFTGLKMKTKRLLAIITFCYTGLAFCSENLDNARAMGAAVDMVYSYPNAHDFYEDNYPAKNPYYSDLLKVAQVLDSQMATELNSRGGREFLDFVRAEFLPLSIALAKSQVEWREQALKISWENYNYDYSLWQQEPIGKNLRRSDWIQAAVIPFAGAAVGFGTGACIGEDRESGYTGAKLGGSAATVGSIWHFLYKAFDCETGNKFSQRRADIVAESNEIEGLRRAISEAEDYQRRLISSHEELISRREFELKQEELRLRERRVNAEECKAVAEANKAIDKRRERQVAERREADIAWQEGRWGGLMLRRWLSGGL